MARAHRTESIREDRTPYHLERSPSSIHLSSDPHMNVWKLPKAGEKNHPKGLEVAMPGTHKAGKSTVPTSQTGKARDWVEYTERSTNRDLLSLGLAWLWSHLTNLKNNT